jgi:hypothetical protein
MKWKENRQVTPLCTSLVSYDTHEQVVHNPPSEADTATEKTGKNLCLQVLGAILAEAALCAGWAFCIGSSTPSGKVEWAPG